MLPYRGQVGWKLCRYGTYPPDLYFIFSSVRYKGLNILQLEILSRVCEGYLNKQIADILELPLRTVADQRTAIYQKLGVHNTAQLVRVSVILRLTSENYENTIQPTNRTS